MMNLKIFEFILNFTKKYYFSKGEEYKDNKFVKNRAECTDREALYITEIIIKNYTIKNIADLYEAEREVEEILKEVREKFGEDAERVMDIISKKNNIAALYQSKSRHYYTKRELIQLRNELVAKESRELIPRKMEINKGKPALTIPKRIS